ncbi:MAG: efflux RND transporter periplasmic adaptor subunit [Gemmatimonadota bacterium]
MNPKLSYPAALLLLVACGGDAPEGGAQTGGPPPASPVEVAAAIPDTVVDAIIATGEIEPLQQIELSADVDGRVTAILFREGARVSAGAPLIKVDDAELQAQVARATADRDLARQGLERTRVLVADKAASQADFERAEATSRSAEASLALLQVRLDRTTVRAPFAGVIGVRRVSVGDYVTPQRALLSLQTVSPQRAVFQVPERYATDLRRGQEVTFRVAALTGRTFTGRVDFVNPVVTLPGRSITVKALVDNPDGALQAGMFIEARLATETRAAATVIPEEAISPAAGASFVWVVIDGKATRREVELGVRTPGFVEIRKGVDLGEQVVVGGGERLYEGALVKPTVVERRPQGAREG